MLRIGEFSRLSQVTVKSLHHYDAIGLLKPARVDSFTNHRYYTVEQLPLIHRIRALKGLGLSLDQIQLLIEDSVDPAQILGMLRLKQAELQQQVREDQARLAQVEFHLRMMQAEESLPEPEIVVKTIPEMPALTLRTSISRDRLIPFGQVLDKAIAANNIELAGSATEIRYAEAYEPVFEDVEFVLPVAAERDDVPLAEFGVLKYRVVPPLARAATIVHEGVHTRSVDEPLALLQRWMVANGYRLGSSNRLVHHRGPLEHAEYVDWIGEIQHEILPA